MSASDFSGRTGFGDFVLENLENVLETPPDVFFKDGPKNETPSTIAKLNLDLTRISGRILVMGRCWSHRTDKECHRNNIDELSLFLNTRYGRNYLIWNLGSPDLQYDTTPFRNQILNFSTSRAVFPTLKNIFNVSRSMAAWLSMDPKNVAILQCKNGLSRSGLAVACFLKYCQIFDSTYESFEYFMQKRSPNNSNWVTVTLKRYLRYFNDVLILNGRVPNPLPLQLHQVILNTVPQFDGQGSCNPGIEVYQNGKMIYSSRVRLAEIKAGVIPSLEMFNLEEAVKRIGKIDLNNEEINEHDFEDEELIKELIISMSGRQFPDYDPLVLIDDHNVLFRLENLIIDRDVQIRVFHQNRDSGQNKTIFNLVFNTGFAAPGLIRLRPSDMELPYANPNLFGTSVHSKDKFPKNHARFDPDFSVDIIVTPIEENLRNISYENVTSQSQAKNLLKLSQFHMVHPDPALISPLELQGHRKFFVRLALQLRNNDIHLSHELLSSIMRSPLFDKLDKELGTLGKLKYDRMRRQSLHKDDQPPIETQNLSPNEEAKVPSNLVENGKEESPFIPSISTTPGPHEFFEDNTKDPVPVETSNGNPPLKVKDNLGSSPIYFIVPSSPPLNLSTCAPPPPPPPLPGHPRTVSNPLSPMTAKPPPPPPIPPPKGTIPPPPPIPPSKGNVPPPPPPPPIPSSKGSVPRAPPIPNSRSKTHASTLSQPDPVQEATKRKIKSKLHWEEIKDRQQIRNSVWVELLESVPDFDPESLNVHKFEELFCIDPEEYNRSRSSTNITLEKKNKPAVHILDLRRVQNVGIGLSRFYKRLTDEEIVKTITRRHTNVLSLDDLLTLKPLIPTSEERSSLVLYTGPLEELGTAERFMIYASKEPYLEWMVNSLIFERQFDSEIDSLSGKITLIIDLLTKIRESPALKLLLRVVLELGNLANYDYSSVPVHARIRGKALGFKMESLIKLQDVKSVDKRTNLLQYVVMTLQEKHEEVFNLPADFSNLAIVRHWDTASLSGHVGEFIASFEKIKHFNPAEAPSSEIESFKAGQQVFLHKGNTELQNLKGLASSLSDSWKKTAEYLGEDVNDRRPEDLFLILDQFFKGFSEAIRAVQGPMVKNCTNTYRNKKNATKVNDGDSSNLGTDDSNPVIPVNAETDSISSTEYSGLTRTDSILSFNSISKPQ